MPKKKTRLDLFSELTWNDIEKWAGGKIVSRGKNYQQQGWVSDLAVTDDDNLVAWVDGTRRYATRVVIDEGALPNSFCTCPYEFVCKHGVAVVIEYLKRVENNRHVPEAKQDDNRLGLFVDGEWDDEPNDDINATSEDIRQDIDDLLKDKTKVQLIDLIHDLAGQYPEMATDLSHRKQLTSGNTKTLVMRLRREIRDIGNKTGWQNYWNSEGYTPDYSGVRNKLEILLKAGYTDEALTLGRELVTSGTRQVEESYDDGETSIEIAACMPVIVEALDRSSFDAADKLNWALDVLLEDQFEVCEAFAEYLLRQHPQTAWHTLADRLLARLKGFTGTKSTDDFSRDYERDRLSDWAIHALEQAGRKNESISLCIAEAKRTGRYDQLVKRLIVAQRYKDAEHWIQEGIQATKEKWPDIAADLRDKLREIRTLEKNWSAVAEMCVEEFVRHPSQQTFTECKKACGRVKAWPNVRESLLHYLEKGEMPWKQKNWPLPESGLDLPDAEERNRFPLVGALIKIAILEKKPDQVLKWYDQQPIDRLEWWYRVDEDTIATAVQAHAPDRAVALWKNKAEQLIARVKPSAYHESVKYLRKAGMVMSKQRKQAQWDQYLRSLRNAHARKRRLLEILDVLNGKPIINKRR